MAESLHPRKGRGASRSSLVGDPALRAWLSLPVHPRSPREAVRKVGKEGAELKASTARRTRSPARTQLPGFAFDRVAPELLHPHHGVPPVPWVATAAMTRETPTTMSGIFPRVCLGPLVRQMSRGPAEMTIGQGPRLGPARIIAALRAKGRVEENIGLAKVDARILARPDKGMIVEGIPAEAVAMIVGLTHVMRRPPKGAVRDEMSAADVTTRVMTVATATGTGAGMTDVTNPIHLRLADLRLATAVEKVVKIAVGMGEVIEGTAVDAEGTMRPETGKNLVRGGRQVPCPAPALEGRGWRACRRQTRPRRSSSCPCGAAGG